MARPSRRQFLKYGAGGAAAITVGSRSLTSGQEVESSAPPSPPTTPFVDPLPIPPATRRVAAFASPVWDEFIDPAQTHFYQLVTEEASVRFHRDLPRTRVWRFRDASVPLAQWPEIVVGPTFRTRIVARPEQGNLVRIFNRLPADHVGFGNPELSTHLHGGHQPALSDGFPEDTTFQGQPFKVINHPGGFFDYFYPNTDVGVGLGIGATSPEVGERPSTLWYHDHLLDFTGPNVYRGLSGFHLVFDELDSGNERDPNPQALRLPSGAFDIPLAIQDRAFAADGSLVFDQFEFDGFLGDKFVVNGKVQPFLAVKRRKYRFRILDGANARLFLIFLADATGRTYSMTQIGRDSCLLAFPLRVERLLLAPAVRMEVVIDFADPRFDGLTELFLENRLRQEDGRGAQGDFADPDLLGQPVPLLKFVLEERVEDPSRVPDTLRPFAPVRADEIAQATVRRFEYERSGGLWVINGRIVDIHDPMVSPRLGQPEIWHLVNNSGGWWHPIHTHLEFGRVLTRNGMLPPVDERDGVAKVETVILGPNDSTEVFFRFRDYPGPYVNHCHNIEHEDHAMMFRYDVIDASGPAVDPSLVAAYAFAEGTGSLARDVSGNGRDGTIAGAAWTTAGRYGKALTFDGLDDRVSIADAAALDLTTGLTVEAWVNPAELSGWRTVALKETAGGLAYALYAHDDAPRPAGYVRVGSMDEVIQGTTALPLNTWTHLAMTYDGAQLSLFVNGEPATVRPLSGSIVVSAGALSLGGNTVWGEHFRGGIDEVRIYSRALSQAEIRRDMDTPLEASPSPVAVELTMPAPGASLAGVVVIEASARSSAGSVAGVQFKLDGAILGTEVTTTPYRISWDSSSVANGAHRLAAVARDSNGNLAASTEIGITVANQAAGLVAAYGFNEGAGSTVGDASGNGHTGTIAGAAWVEGGRFGRALSFDGNDDWITVNDAAALDLTTAMTLEAWVKPTALGGWRTVILKELSGTALCYALYADDDVPRPAGYIRTGGADQAVPGSAALPLDAWSHLAVTYDGGTMRLYVNGTLAGSRTQTGAVETSNGALRIGGNSVWGEYFAGLIDEVRIYTRALTPTEIQHDMMTPV